MLAISAVTVASTLVAFIFCQLFNESVNELGLRLYSILYQIETMTAPFGSALCRHYHFTDCLRLRLYSNDVTAILNLCTPIRSRTEINCLGGNCTIHCTIGIGGELHPKVFQPYLSHIESRIRALTSGSLPIKVPRALNGNRTRIHTFGWYRFTINL